MYFVAIMALRYRPSLAQYARVRGCPRLTITPVTMEIREKLFRDDSMLIQGLYQAYEEISKVAKADKM